MKLKAYAAKIQALAEKFPNARVIYSSDDEGNNFSEVAHEPTPGHFVKSDNEFQDCSPVNAVCVN